MKSRTIPALALGLIGAPFFFGLLSSGRPQAPQSKPDYLNAQLPVERRVADLLSRMTLEEKIAQTHALWQQRALITDEKGNFSPEKAAAVLKDGIGQIARASERKNPRDNAIFTNAIQKFLLERTRLGVPAMVHE